MNLFRSSACIRLLRGSDQRLPFGYRRGVYEFWSKR